MDDNLISDLTKLPVADRLRLIEGLWDSLDAEMDTLPIPDWQREELDRRFDALDSGASVGPHGTTCANASRTQNDGPDRCSAGS